MSYNLLTNLSSKLFANMTILKQLFLMSNELNEINFLHVLPSSLEMLYLNGNNINTLKSSVFTQMFSLEYLNLNENNLRQIEPNAFTSLVKLKYLDLSHNQLVFVYDVMFSNLIELNSLDLSYNQLVYIDSQSFSNMNKLTMVYLFNNPISLKQPEYVERLCTIKANPMCIVCFINNFNCS